MENYQAGDLADIVRATASTAVDHGTTADWQFQSNNNPIAYRPVDDPTQDFSDPYTSSCMMRNSSPLSIPSSSGFFYNNSNIIKVGVDDQESRITTRGFASSNITAAGDNTVVIAHKSLLDEDMTIRRPPAASNMFSRMLMQISPNSKLPGDPPLLISNNNNGCLISPISSSRNCLVKTTTGPAGLQISSPRNTGIKGRKSQAKKVVCVPAPAPAATNSSRPSSGGEVVPSDLWAWRKYGQKPIKGSPYPRGYYRCSSSKGCLARKQVERSRTDPNMLVITYTSEHNHPWPTQRNALAGSTRSSSHSASNTAANSKNSPPRFKPTNHKRDDQQNENASTVKKEMMDEDYLGHEFDDHDKPTFMAHSEESCSFFTDLGEIEADQLVFPQGFCSNIDHDEAIRENELYNPFTFYDWATSCGEGL